MTTNSTEKQSERVKKAANDVGNYLAMGLSLLRGRAKGVYENLETLRYTVLQEQNTEMELFSTRRNVDFSLFKPRGHYTKSESLENYFRAMMWIGIVNLHMDALHQLLCGVILLHYLRESKMFDCVQQFDSLLSSLVGSGADSLSMRDFTKFISPATMAKLIDPCASSDRERLKLLQSLQQRIIEKSLASQIGTSFESSTAEQEGECLVSLALFGQRFVWSAFVFSRLVGGEVVHEGVMQPRRVPSAVDIAFTLFGNNEAGQELVNRMEMSLDADEFVPHRDRIPISSNLVALRKVIDEEFTKESTATASASTLWLLALRALSLPSPNRSSTFHNGTWQRRQMNTQIASFTQLRHDTVLYSQQSSLTKPLCEFPDGMVDPFSEFWRRMREMPLRMNDIEDDAQTLRDFHSRSNFNEFASTIKTLEDISVLQTSGKKLNEDQVTFMQSIIEKHFGSGSPTYTGWYPSLFYGAKRKSCTRDVLVVDVHTDYIDPGHVLHLGVGDPVIGFFIVNEVMYVGPLFSSYEFTTPLGQRMTDEEFEGEMPWIETPEWALQSFLCRGEYGENPDVAGNESMDT
ncbi:hypothetical protein P3T76_001510 [Phytophthora citrophthora]|uniref:Uncharacterized protein n=1 Tax=Phytophthora citrophthora TaxID=4793 RepID=A0AAD9GYQ2_9STRA|nr:hypothetical protein P3T76_001510 [Phytophthora citrophthora]